MPGEDRPIALSDDLDRLIDDAYAAAADAAVWADWSWRLTERLGGVASNFAMVDAAGIVQVQIIHHDNIPALDRYFEEGLHTHDPQVPFVMSLTRSCVYTDADYLDLTRPGAARHHRWARDHARIDHHASAVVRIAGGRHRGAVSIHRHVEAGPVPAETSNALACILPHLGRALQLGYGQGEKLVDSFWEGIRLRDDEPALLLSRDGRLLRLTAGMEALIAGGDGLGAAAGSLTAFLTADADRIADAVRQAIDPHHPRSSAMPITRRSGRAPFVLTVLPLPSRVGLLPQLDPAALVTVIDPARPRPAMVAAARAAFDLSGREAELAALLVEGHSVETAAATLGIGLPTVRTHLRHLFAKTRTTRQVDLVRLIDRLQ